MVNNECQPMGFTRVAFLCRSTGLKSSAGRINTTLQHTHPLLINNPKINISYNYLSKLLWGCCVNESTETLDWAESGCSVIRSIKTIHVHVYQQKIKYFLKWV